MSQHLPTAGANPVLQFRLRALIGATTAVAVLAAIAGPYYRSQPPERQSALLVYWSCIVVFTGVGLWTSWRDLWRVPREAGAVRYLLWVTRGKYSLFHRWPGQAAVLLAWLVLISFNSVTMSVMHSPGLPNAPRMYTVMSRVGAGMTLLTGVGYGIATGALVMGLLRRPVFLTDNGVSQGTRGTAWRHVRFAKWATNRPGVLRISWTFGDLYADPPPRQRDEIESFLRQRTTFLVDGAWLPAEPEPPASERPGTEASPFASEG